MKKPYFEIRPSPIQGLGAFTTRPIPKGTRLIEYTGERISPKEADSRYDDDRAEHPRVLLFTVNKRTVIDAAVGGNAARFINHSCEPNCEAIIENGHVFIQALKGVAAGVELTYDYNLTLEDHDDPHLEERYACHCGAKTCRGTMLRPKENGQKKKRTRPQAGPA